MARIRWSRLLGAKTTLYDEGIHLPLIIAAPDAAWRGVRNEAMVSW